MAGGEWIDVGIKAGISLVSGLGGLLIGVWKWGRSSAQKEQALKDKVGALREEVRKEMASHSQKVDDGNDLLVSQFKESFEGLRRQHDVFVLDVERRFLPKEDFREFLQEYRADQRRTDDKLDRLLGSKP